MERNKSKKLGRIIQLQMLQSVKDINLKKFLQTLENSDKLNNLNKNGSKSELRRDINYINHVKMNKI